MVVFITIMLMIGYAINMFIYGYAAINGATEKIRMNALLSIVIVALAAAGVLYLAAN